MARTHSVSVETDRRSPSESFSPGRGLVVWGLGLAWLVLFGVFFFSQVVGGRLQIPRLSLLLQLPEILAANFQPQENSGWQYLPQRFDLVLSASVVLAAACGLGRVLLRAIGIHISWKTAEGAAFTLGLGLSAWSLLTLGLGLAGVLSQGVFIVAAVVSFAAGLFVDWRTGGGANASAGEPAGVSRRTNAPIDGQSGGLRRPARQDEVSPWLRWGVLAACVPFALAMLLGSLLPTTDFDVKEYHLGGPKEYWLAGRVQFLPHNVYTSFPFLTEMLSLSAMAIRGDWLRGAQAGQGVLMAYAVVTACGAFALTRRLAGGRAAWLAVLVILSAPWVYRISIIAYTEGALASYLVLTVLALVSWVDGHQDESEFGADRGRLLLTGLMAGSAAATKYPGVLSAVIPVGLAILAVSWRRSKVGRINWRGGLAAAGVYSAGVLIAFGPWLFKNLIETGNPVYPLLWSVFGGESFDAATNVRWKAAHGAPVHLFREPALILPDLWQRILDIALRSDWQSPLVCSLAPLSLLAWRRARGLGWLWLYIVWLLLTWCWLTHRIDRFWVPMIPLLAVLAGIGLQSLLQATESDRDTTAGFHPALLQLAVWSVVGLCVLFNLGFNTTGLAGYSNYLQDMAAARDTALGKVSGVRVCNAAGLGPESKVLFVGEAAHFEAEFPYVYHTVFDDSIFEQWCAAPHADRPKSQWPLRDSAEIRRTLAAQGITHVCVNWLEVVRYRLPGSYGYSDFVHPDRFESLIEAGVLERTPFARPVLWEELDPSQQQEFNTWAPSLSVRFGEDEAVLAIELYRVRVER